MDSMATFTDMIHNMKPAVGDSGDALMQLLSDAVGNLDFVKLYKKPEIQRLLASHEMREAIAVSDIPLLQTLYGQFYAEAAEDKSFQIGHDTAYYVLIFTAIASLMSLFGKYVLQHNL